MFMLSEAEVLTSQMNTSHRAKRSGAKSLGKKRITKPNQNQNVIFV
jgi:hypothetical protein